MNDALLHGLVILAASYLLGSVPFAVVVSRLFGLADPRSFGSGNPGATNVLRSGNKLAAFITLVGDAAKGAAAVWLCQCLGQVWALPAWLPVWAGVFAFAGHLYPVFLGFRGGKGVATFLGTVIMLAPIVGGMTCLLWLGVAAWTRFSSLASVVCSASAILAVWGVPTRPGMLPGTIVMAAFLWWRHRVNLQRLMAGTETRIGNKQQAVQTDGDAAA